MIQEFIKKYNIKQVYETSAVNSLNLNMKYKNNIDNTIFYGVYTNEDINAIINHSGKKWVLWAGNDANIKYKTRLEIINFMKTQQIENHLVKDINVEKNLLLADIIPINLNFKPINLYNLGSFLENNKITQISVSKSIDYPNIDKTQIKDYKYVNTNTLFYGMYNMEDYVKFKDHNSNKWVLWVGNDANINYENRKQIMSGVSKLCGEGNLAANNDIESNFEKLNLQNQNINKAEKLNIKDIQNIQLRVSSPLKHLEKRLLKKYNLKEYKTKDEPVLFFGLYTIKDTIELNAHKGIKYLMWGGTDALFTLPQRKFNLISIENIKDVINIAISDDIENRLTKENVTCKKLELNLVDKDLFKPSDKIGKKIFIYNGYGKGNENLYGNKIYEDVMKKLPNYEYILSNQLNLPYEKMPEIYADCFIGLRLTKNDGNANMVQEMEAMKIPVVHNLSTYGLKWKSTYDIINHINKKNSSILNMNKKVEAAARKKSLDDMNKKVEEAARKKSLDDITIIINSYKPDKQDLINSVNGCLKQINVNVKVIVSTLENDPTIEYINELNNSNVELVISLLNEHPGKGPKGIYFQLNKALKEVKTKYFSYFSSNDIIYPTKSFNEIKKIEEENTIFCFSRYKLTYPNQNGREKNFKYKQSKMNLEKLLIGNFINDCATIDLTKLNQSLQFNYEKYENTCYWHLWISLLSEHGNNCMSYNNNIEWNYIRDENKSQALQRKISLPVKSRELGIRYYMLSTFTKKSITDYENLINCIYNERQWWYNSNQIKSDYKISVFVYDINLQNVINILHNYKIIKYEIICYKTNKCPNISSNIKSFINNKFMDMCFKITYVKKTDKTNWYYLSDDNTNDYIEYLDDKNIYYSNKYINLSSINIKNIFIDDYYMKCFMDNNKNIKYCDNFIYYKKKNLYDFNKNYKYIESQKKENIDIQQIVLSYTIKWIKPRLSNLGIPIYRANDKNINYNLNTLIIGYYKSQRDINLKDMFTGKKYILWGGSDSKIITDHNKTKFNDCVHICISKIIYNNLSKFDGLKLYYDCFISKELKDKFIFENIPVTNKIYYYCPLDNIYGKYALNYLIKKLPEIDFYTFKNIKKYDIINYYKECFMAIRLTSYDGNSNTSIELGMMGRKCICLNDYPNCIKWDLENLNETVDFIKKEYKLVKEYNMKYNNDAEIIRNKCISYINKYSNIL